jgi:hypothetical protein
MRRKAEKDSCGQGLKPIEEELQESVFAGQNRPTSDGAEEHVETERMRGKSGAEDENDEQRE